MGVLIDSSILIAFERGQLDLASHVAGHEDAEVYLSVITASELLHGAHRATDPALRARRLAFVEGLLTRFPLVDIDLEVARAHAALWSTLAQQGQMIGMNDAWIGASCIARGLVLVTGNLREFHRIPGLQVERWL